jgi:hypothetical protein
MPGRNETRPTFLVCRSRSDPRHRCPLPQIHRPTARHSDDTQCNCTPWPTRAPLRSAIELHRSGKNPGSFPCILEFVAPANRSAIRHTQVSNQRQQQSHAAPEFDDLPAIRKPALTYPFCARICISPHTVQTNALNDTKHRAIQDHPEIQNYR